MTSILSVGVLPSAIYAQNDGSGFIDTLVLGNAASETAHQTTSELSQTITGGLNQPARILLPAILNPGRGSLSFIIKVDPAKQNYVTARFGDPSPVRTDSSCSARESRSDTGLWAISRLSILATISPVAPCIGRFYYQTSPLPTSLTNGKTLLHAKYAPAAQSGSTERP